MMIGLNSSVPIIRIALRQEIMRTVVLIRPEGSDARPTVRAVTETVQEVIRADTWHRARQAGLARIRNRHLLGVKPSLLDFSLLPGRELELPFFGGASVIVCQGADLIAIRSRRPPQGDTAAVTAKCRVFGRGLPGPTKCSIG